jgi:hypothetical protein
MNQEYKMKRKIFGVVLILIVITVFSSCEKFKIVLPDVDPDATWSLQNDIQPIFNNNCTSCHDGSPAPDLRSGTSFQALTDGEHLNTADPGSSTLYTTIEGTVHRARTPDMTDNDRLKILYWITQGAINN